MGRFTLVAMVVLAGPAWAVGERIVVPPADTVYAEQLRDALCLSMECVTAESRSIDARVTARLVTDKKRGAHVEVRVVDSSGGVRATLTAPVHEGRVSSMDLVSLTSATVRAIETRERLVESGKRRSVRGSR
jgi:hypothetical protein